MVKGRVSIRLVLLLSRSLQLHSSKSPGGYVADVDKGRLSVGKALHSLHVQAERLFVSIRASIWRFRRSLQGWYFYRRSTFNPSPPWRRNWRRNALLDSLNLFLQLLVFLVQLLDDWVPHLVQVFKLLDLRLARPQQFTHFRVLPLVIVQFFCCVPSVQLFFCLHLPFLYHFGC